jgi:hypothetical protein
VLLEFLSRRDGCFHLEANLALVLRLLRAELAYPDHFGEGRVGAGANEAAGLFAFRLGCSEKGRQRGQAQAEAATHP